MNTVTESDAGTSSGLIPKEVDELECHFNWVSYEDVCPELRSSHIQRSSEWNECIKKDPLAAPSDKLGYPMSNAVFMHWEGLPERAAGLLDAALGVLEGEERDRVAKEHVQAFRYLIDANKAVLGFRMGGFVRAMEAWRRALQIDINGCAKTKAMILTMKARFVGLVGQIDERVVLSREVVELHPDFPEYLDSYFKALRKVRREKNFLSSPTEEEIQIMQRAFELDPTSTAVLRGMATIYHDILKAKNQDDEFTCKLLEDLGLTEFVCKMKLFAKLAYESNPGSHVTAIRYAEILSYGATGKKNFENNTAECEEHFLKCLETWPNSSEVLHKIGKFYASIDPEFGLKHLIQSIDIDGENFPAIMDYLRICYREDKDRRNLGVLLDFLDEKIPVFGHRKGWQNRLSCLKATLLSKAHEFKEALDIWISVIDSDPEIVKDKNSLMGKGTFHGLFNGNDFLLLRSYIENEIDVEPMGTRRSQLYQSMLDAISQRPTYGDLERQRQRRSDERCHNLGYHNLSSSPVLGSGSDLERNLSKLAVTPELKVSTENPVHRDIGKDIEIDNSNPFMYRTPLTHLLRCGNELGSNQVADDLDWK